MRPIIIFALIFASLTVVQGQLVVPQLTNLFTSIEIQSLKNQMTELIRDEIVHQGNLSTLINRFQPMFEQWLNRKLSSKRRDVSSEFLYSLLNNSLANQLRVVLEEYFNSNLQGRADIDVLIQQIIGTTTSALPGVIIGLMGGK